MKAYPGFRPFVINFKGRYLGGVAVVMASNLTHAAKELKKVYDQDSVMRGRTLDPRGIVDVYAENTEKKLPNVIYYWNGDY